MKFVRIELDTKLNWAKNPKEQYFDISLIENHMSEDTQDK